MLFFDKLMYLLLLTTFISTIFTTTYFDKKSQNKKGEYNPSNKSLYKYGKKLSYVLLTIILISLPIFLYIMINIVKDLNSNKVVNRIDILTILVLFIVANSIFGNIYYFLYLRYPNTFKGINNLKGTGDKYFFTRKYQTFIYFSFTTFFTVGYGDISPHSNICRMISVIEYIISFFLTTFIFSIFLTKNINASNLQTELKFMRRNI